MADNDVMEMIMTIIQIPCNIAFPSHHNPKSFFFTAVTCTSPQQKTQNAIFPMGLITPTQQFPASLPSQSNPQCKSFSVPHIYPSSRRNLSTLPPPLFFFSGKGRKIISLVFLMPYLVRRYLKYARPGPSGDSESPFCFQFKTSEK